jgi:hypothetical protein
MFGMMTMVDLLDHSLNPNMNEATVQFNTIQKMCSAISNYERISAKETEHKSLVGCEKGGQWLSLTPQCTVCGVIVL